LFILKNLKYSSVGVKKVRHQPLFSAVGLLPCCYMFFSCSLGVKITLPERYHKRDEEEEKLLDINGWLLSNPVQH